LVFIRPPRVCSPWRDKGGGKTAGNVVSKECREGEPIPRQLTRCERESISPEPFLVPIYRQERQGRQDRQERQNNNSVNCSSWRPWRSWRRRWERATWQRIHQQRSGSREGLPLGLESNCRRASLRVLVLVSPAGEQAEVGDRQRAQG